MNKQNAKPPHSGEASTMQQATEITSDQWFRVSPIAILYFFVKTLFFLINNVLIYMLPLFAFNLNKLKENPYIFSAGASVIVLLVLIGAIIKYIFYFYRLSADRVEIRQGLFQKSHLDLPFSKIQNVKIIQPFYYRLSTFCIIELDTAGSVHQEANIVAIRMDMAESFMQKVQSMVNSNSADDATLLKTAKHNAELSVTAEKDPREKLLNKRSIKDLMIHGVTNNRIWIFLGFIAPFYNLIAENIGNFFTHLGIDIASYLSYESQTLGIFILNLMSLVMLFMLIVVTLSIIGSIFVFYNYKLSRCDSRYIRRSGLLTKHEISVKISRIQRVVQRQDWLDILIGRVNLSFEQNSSGIAKGNQASQISSSNILLVPSVTILEANQLVQGCFDTQALDSVPYMHISRRFILRMMLYPCLPFISFLLLIGLLQSYTVNGWIALAVVSLLLFCACVLRWYRWGYFRSEHFIYVRRGFFGYDHLAFPLNKVQQTSMFQTPFMRANNLANLRIVLASGALSVPYLTKHEVTSTIDASLLILARDKPAWM